MNKLFKILISILGGVDLAFSIIMPIFITLMMVQIYEFSQINQFLLLLIGFLAAVSKGLKTWI